MITADSADGYCVIQFDALPIQEEQLPGQLNLDDMEEIGDAENTEEETDTKEPDGQTDGIYGEG